MPTDFSKARMVAKAVPLILSEKEVTPYARRIAEDFNSLLYSINQRLAKCETLVSAGRVREAVFAAEEEPNLLDLIERVEFAQADTWRTWCRENGLPVPERPAAKPLRALNDAYSRQQQAGGVDLYPHYREAFLAGDLHRALGTLRSILRLNLKDDRARSEMARLKEIYGTRQRAKLVEALQANASEEVIQLVDEIEDLELTSAQTGEPWGKAQLMRSVDLIAKLAAAGEDAPLTEVRSALTTIEHWIEQLGVRLPPREEAIRQELRQRILKEEQRQADRARREAAIAQFRETVATARSRAVADTAIAPAEIQAVLASLTRAWERVKGLEGVVGSSVEREYTEVCRRLGDIQKGILEAARRRRLQSMVVTGAVTLVLVGYAALEIATAAFTRSLTVAVERKDEIAAKKYLGMLPSAIYVPLGHSRYRKAWREVKRFVEISDETAGKCRTLLGSPGLTQPNFSTLESAESFYLGRRDVTAQLASLPPSIRGELEAQFQKQVEAASRLEKDRVPQLREQFQKAVDAARETTLESVEAKVASGVGVQLRDAMGGLDRCRLFAEQSTAVAEAERPSLIRGAQEVGDTLRRTLAALDDWQTTLGQLRGKTNFVEYIKAIQGIANSSNVLSTLAANAAQLSPEVLSTTNLILGLVRGSSSSLNTGEENGGDPLAKPDVANPLQINRILDDLLFNAEVHRYEVTITHPTERVETWLTTAALSTGSDQKDFTAWVLQSTEPGRKGVVLKGSLLLDRGVIHLGTETILGGYTLIGSPVGPTLIDFCGIRDVLRDRSRKTTPAMLRAITKVAQERNLLGRVKAYVISRLYQIVRSEPRKYGLQFSPELAAFVGRVDALNLSMGQPDTLFQSENGDDRDSRIDALCADFLKVNYLNAFETRKRLVDQLLTDGVVFVGFVDSGRLQLNGESPAGELFAYDIGTGDVVSGGRLAKSANLSPVFRLKTRKRDHLLRLRREFAGFESSSLPEFFSNQ